jgi:hypothetical protein
VRGDDDETNDLCACEIGILLTVRYAKLRAHSACVVSRPQNCFVCGPSDCAGKVLRVVRTCNLFGGVLIVFGIVNGEPHGEPSTGFTQIAVEASTTVAITLRWAVGVKQSGA